MANGFSKIAIIVLNQVIRLFTAKWHKKSLAVAFQNHDKCICFRNELKELQVEFVKYFALIAELAQVEDLTNAIVDESLLNANNL